MLDSTERLRGSMATLGMVDTGRASVVYEFAPHEDSIIGAMATRAKLWGYLSLIAGGVMTMAGLGVMVAWRGDEKALTAGGAMLAIALAPCISGYSYVAAGRAMRRVVTSSGNDIAHIMSAIASLRSAVRVEVIASILAFCIGFGLGLYRVLAR